MTLNRMRTACAVALCGFFVSFAGADAIAGESFARHLSALKSGNPPKGFGNVCGKFPWACSGKAGASGKLSEAQIRAAAAQINSAVNRSVRFMSDRQQYGVEEHWTLPASGKGDCEDYALLKKKKLIEAGVSPNRLMLAQVLTGKKEPHLVLVLRSSDGDIVLDSLSSSLRHWNQTGYTFIKMQNAQRKAAWDTILIGPYARR